jgi:hypothetical protein
MLAIRTPGGFENMVTPKISGPGGCGVAWAETAADVLALAGALEHAAEALRRHGVAKGPDQTGKPN